MERDWMIKRTTNEVKDDLYGPDSGIKWFNFQDPEGNLIHMVL
jgi:hypothetical protein